MPAPSMIRSINQRSAHTVTQGVGEPAGRGFRAMRGTRKIEMKPVSRSWDSQPKLYQRCPTVQI
jgi:hypothetical protein